jgi:torulene dioxygenase
MSIIWNKNVAQSIDQKWDPKADTLFYVVDRHQGGVVAKYKVRIFRHETKGVYF